MAYTGATSAKNAREALGNALGELQRHKDVPEDVMSVASNLAQAVGALFEAEKASSDVDGKAAVKAALGTLSQTLALLQDVKSSHPGIEPTARSIADTMSVLFPLSTVPTKRPTANDLAAAAAAAVEVPKAAAVPQIGQGGAPRQSFAQPAKAPAPAPKSGATGAQPAVKVADPVAGTGPRMSSRPAPPVFAAGTKRNQLEANIGATTESNFFVGFSGEISDGGVFIATYNVLPKNSAVAVLVTLPGGFETTVNGYVRFVRDPMDFSAESEPGIGVQFESLDPNARELILRFIRKRAPLFYED